MSEISSFKNLDINDFSVFATEEEDKNGCHHNALVLLSPALAGRGSLTLYITPEAAIELAKKLCIVAQIAIDNRDAYEAQK